MTEQQTPHPWEEEERRVQAALAEPLASYLTLTRDCEALAFDLLRRVANPVHSAQLYHAHATLVARVLRDMRACEHLVVRGFTMQAYTVASSCMEATYLLGFIGQDQQRAESWLTLDMGEKLPWSVYDLMMGTATYLRWSDDPAERQRLVGEEYRRLYDHLCAVKHVHAAPERHRYWIAHPGGTTLQLTPTVNDRVIREARRALMSVARLAATACWVWWQAELLAVPELDEVIADLFKRTGDLLDGVASS